MKTKFFSLIVLLAILITACQPASAPTQIAMEPRREVTVVETVEVVERPWAEPEPTAAAVGENTYQDYGVNPPERTLYDHLSTFALDVDTASYAVHRRYIQDGQLPPIEAVRAEEFINAFEQGYEPPASAAFTIYADGGPTPFTSDGSYFLRFGIQGYRVPDYARKPLALTFVIDVSGSMGMENRLGLVKRALELLVEQLNREDTVAIVVYGSNARQVLDPTDGDQYREIMRAIDRLSPEGSTNAEAGLRLGYRSAMTSYNPEASNRVILCSDGVANTGKTSADDILEMVAGYVAEGVDLTSVGFGMGNFNDVLLEQLANDGNGNYFYVDTLEAAEKVFDEDLTGTLQTIAYDAKAQVDFNPDVVAEYRLIGYENREIADQQFRDDRVDAGEIGAGHTVTALYQVKLLRGADGRIATVQLRWQDAETREVREINGNFNTWDLYASFEESDPRYQLAVLVSAYAEVLRASPYVDTNLGELASLARYVARQLPEDMDVQELADLVREAAWIAGE